MSSTILDTTTIASKGMTQVQKALGFGLRKTGGRNNKGRITSRHIGGGHKRNYRVVDFKRALLGIPATVSQISYDPNRSAYLATLKYENGLLSTIIAPKSIEVGAILVSSDGPAPITIGNQLRLEHIPVGVQIHNIESTIGRGASLCRSAGTYGEILEKDWNSGYALIRLISGEVRKIHLRCTAVIGIVSNPEASLIKLRKAGQSRWLGIRPHVRGVVMNPVDHPHGGGGGKKKGGKPPVSPTGKPAKGKHTRSNLRTQPFIVRRRS